MPVVNGTLTWPVIAVGTLTVDHTQCGTADSSNYPVCVSVTNAKFRDASLGTGGYVTQLATGIPFNLVFTTENVQYPTTLLSWEIQFWDRVTGQIVAHVKIPTLSHTADTVFYVNVGNPTYTSFQGGATGAAWNSNFLMVQHEEDVSALNDSTANGNNLTNNGTTTAAGVVHNAAQFSRASTFNQNGSTSTALCPPAMSVSLWVYINSFPVNYSTVVERFTATQGYAMMFTAGGKMAVYLTDSAGTYILYDGTGANTLSPNTWYHIAYTYQAGSNLIGYINAGVDKSVAGTANGLISVTQALLLGSSIFPLRDTTGRECEFRLFNDVRTPSWWTSEYNNFVPGSTFVTLVI